MKRNVNGIRVEALEIWTWRRMENNNCVSVVEQMREDTGAANKKVENEIVQGRFTRIESYIEAFTEEFWEKI